MQTLIIYDTSGYILSQTSGDARTPIGIPFLWVDVPVGSYIKSIDLSGTVDVAIIEERPKSETEVTLNTLKSDIDAIFGMIDFIMTKA